MIDSRCTFKVTKLWKTTLCFHFYFDLCTCTSNVSHLQFDGWKKYEKLTNSGNCTKPYKLHKNVSPHSKLNGILSVESRVYVVVRGETWNRIIHWRNHTTNCGRIANIILFLVHFIFPFLRRFGFVAATASVYRCHCRCRRIWKLLMKYTERQRCASYVMRNDNTNTNATNKRWRVSLKLENVAAKHIRSVWIESTVFPLDWISFSLSGRLNMLLFVTDYPNTLKPTVCRERRHTAHPLFAHGISLMKLAKPLHCISNSRGELQWIYRYICIYAHTHSTHLPLKY